MKRLGAPVTVIAAVAGFAALFWWARTPGDDVPAEGGPVPHLTVFMNQSIRRMEIEGMSAEKKSRFLPHGNLLEPCRLTVVTTDGKRLEVDLRSMSVITDLVNKPDFDSVAGVIARRPLTPGKFQEAVADLLATIRGWGIEPHADLLELTKWDNAAGHESRGIVLPINAGSMPLSELMNLSIKFYPDPDRGWFYLMTFTVPFELTPSHIRDAKERAIRHRAIESIRSVLTVPVQIEEMFPITTHYIANFVFDGNEGDFHKTMGSEAWFGDRYHLTMRVPVELDRNDKTITSLRGEPTFILQELEALANNASAGGRVDPVWRREHRFDLAAWNKLVAAGGDFSAIGIEIDPTPVIDAAKYVRQWFGHMRQYRVSLLGEVRERAVKSAAKFLPAALQIERMFSTSNKKQEFPSTDHFFEDFAFTGKDGDSRKTLVTESYFNDRYQLTMRTAVEIDTASKTVTRLRGEPTFVLREIESVVEAPVSIDTLPESPKPKWRREDRFDLAAWNKVVAADGDFSVIGITIDTTPQSKSDAERVRSYVHSQRSFRDRVSLLDAGAGDGEARAKKLPEPEDR